jgi:hypothetical protein
MLARPSEHRSHTNMKKKRHPKSVAERVDLREQTFNGRESGPIDRVQLPVENITTLHGIVLDLDLGLLRADGPAPLDLSGPEEYARATLLPMLSRHPALRGAEVRDTGRNLHTIVWLDPPIEFQDDGQRRRWAGIVRAVQAALPIDPDQPGITALTRPVGSVNGKTGREVRVLRPGTPVPADEVLRLYDRLARSPFRTVMEILLGSDRVSPCPCCRAEGSSLAALDREGRCYGSCGRVRLERLYDAYLIPRTPASKEDAHGVG